jgi:uncharacterized protein YdcH (DUF465 family)
MIEALKQALEALEEVRGWQWAGPMRVMDEVDDAITALRQAIEEAEHEPVGWIDSKLNPIKREWVGLTDELKVILIKKTPNWTAIQLIEETELLLKEKNT